MNIIETTQNGNTIITITLSNNEKEVLNKEIPDIKEFILNLLESRYNSIIDDIVEKSGLGSRYTDKVKKLQIISQLKAEKPDLFKPNRGLEDVSN